jgi:hypothetical protein
MLEGIRSVKEYLEVRTAIVGSAVVKAVEKTTV